MSFIIEEFTNDALKSINYFGIDLSVPFDAKFIATDDDGQIYTFDDEPILVSTGTYFAANDTNAVYVGKCKFKGDTKESIVDIKNERKN